MRATDSVKYTGLSDSFSGAPFTLAGGLYRIKFVAENWNGGTVTINELGPDNSTWLTASCDFTEDGGGTVYLPPGQFRFVVTGATNLSALVCRIPLE
jgi:hypothetical protein